MFGDYLLRAMWSFEAIGAALEGIYGRFPSVDLVAVRVLMPYLGKGNNENKSLKLKLP